MANAYKAQAEAPVRAMLVGDPGTGKTGALAPLVDAGFKLRILDYDGNLEPLFKFVKDKEKLANVDFLHFEDPMRLMGQFMAPAGIPTAFTDGVRALDHWKYKDGDKEIDLGASKDWGPDTIVVLDSLTKMGDAAMRRAMKLLNKTPVNTTKQTWGLAMAEQAYFIERLTSNTNRHHVIVLAHLRMISPKGIEKGDDETVKTIKERVIDMIDTKFFPRALGYELPQTIGGEFPTLLKMQIVHKPGNKVFRKLITVPQEHLDIKVPTPDLPPELDISDGMLKVFSALSPNAVAAVMGKGVPALPHVATEEGVSHE